MPANAKKTLPTGIFRKGKGYGYAFDGARHPDGTRNQLTKAGFRTVDEAVWARAEHMAATGRGPQVAPSKQTVAEYLQEWLTGRDDVRDSTWYVYKRSIDRHITPRLGETKLRELAPTQLLRWQKALGQKLAPATVSAVRAILATALNDAVRDERLATNPLLKVASVTREQRHIASWTSAEMAAFLAIADSDELAALWRLALLTGLRRGELLALRWADVDLDHGRLSVAATLTVDRDGHQTIGPPKSRTSARTIALSGTVVEGLRRHRSQQLRRRLKLGRLWHDLDLVFPGDDGAVLSPSTLRLRANRLMAQAGVPVINIHGLRHTSATFGLAAGEHIKLVQDRLGHASSTITLDLYSHVHPEMREESAARLEAALTAIEQRRRERDNSM